MSNWYGIKGVQFNYINDTADATVTYKGVEVNSVIPESTMWERWIYDDDGKLIEGREADIDGFSRFMRENANEVKELICLAMSPLAALTLNNFGGIGILAIDDGSVVSGENYGDGWFRINKASIQYNSKGNPFFIRYGRRYYLDQFLRCKGNENSNL